MRQHSRELMARLVADWCHQGIVDRSTQARLSERYDRKGSMFSALLKWLGIFAILNLALGVLASHHGGHSRLRLATKSHSHADQNGPPC